MTKRPPWWLWPNLLSLDAPLVAVGWLWMFSVLWRVPYQSGWLFLGLPLCVWVVYVLDRLIDGTRHDGERKMLRHEVHIKYKKTFVALVVAGICFSVWIGLAYLPSGFFFYFLPILFLLAGYFVWLFFFSRAGDTRSGKNIIVALIFAYGTACGPYFYAIGNVVTMLFSFEILAFAWLCLINLNAIDLWEEEKRSGGEEDETKRLFLVGLPVLFLAGFSFLAAFGGSLERVGLGWLGKDDYTKPFYYAMLVSTSSIQALDHMRGRFSANALRALADVALLLPLPIFLSWRSF